MALLVYSPKCKYSMDTVSFIKANPSLIQVVRFWNVTTDGLPSQKITRVPTIVTNGGEMIVGADIKAWLQNLIPCEFENFEGWGPAAGSNFDGTEAPSNMFSIDQYGVSLQPQLTPELEEKIGRSVSDAYQNFPK
jgi:hypothetical protein